MVKRMRIFHTALILTIFGAPGVHPGATTAAAQAPVQPTVQAAAGGAASPDKAATSRPAVPSGLLQPAFDALQQTVGALKMDKWKKGSARDEAIANITSILHDLQSTLPPLLKDVDGSPHTMSKVLPVTSNIDALYVVLLRTFDLSQVAAPEDQIALVEHGLTSLQASRKAFEGYAEETATVEEKQIAELQTALKTKPVPECLTSAPPPSTPEPAPAATPAKKVVKKRKPAVAPPAANATPAGAPKPNP